MREDARRLGDLPELTVQTLNTVGRVHDLPYLGRVLVEGRQLGPFGLPAFEVYGVLGPGILHAFKFDKTGPLGRCGIDRSEVGNECLLVFVGYVLHGVPYLMDDALLYVGVGKYGTDCFGESRESVYGSDNDIFHATVLDLGEDMHPELRTFALPNPYTQDIPHSFEGGAEDNVRGTVHYFATIPHLEVDTVERHQGVAGCKRSVLPLGDQGEDLVGDRTDHGARYVDTVDVVHVGRYVACGESLCIHRDDAFLDVALHSLVPPHHQGFEGTVAVSGHRKIRSTERGFELLLTVTVSGVATPSTDHFVFLVSQMLVELRFEHTLQSGCYELLGERSDVREGAELFCFFLESGGIKESGDALIVGGCVVHVCEWIVLLEYGG